MTTDQANDTPKDVWADDRLGRKPYADFLTTYLRNRCVTEKDGAQSLTPFCISIDAKWGEGKTFFLQTWLDDLKRDETNLAFLFDAWTSDFDTDPIVAFMAAFKAALDAEFKKTPVAASLNHTLENGAASLEKGIRKLGRAVVPAFKAVGKGLLKRHVPGALEDIAAHLDSDDESAKSPQDEDKKKGSWTDDAAESLFKSLLEESTKRKELIKEFREHVRETLRYLADTCGFKLPMFVFIDELDRCRPTFAVELLEGLKHVFNIPGLCFVVATNIEQLAHSVKAVYGEGFDGTAYLQRFFEVGYKLPQQDPTKYIYDLLSGRQVFAEGNCYTGVPQRGFIGYPEESGSHVALEWVATEFGLDLRSLRRVVEMASAVLESIKNRDDRHAMWAFILTATYVKDRNLFECLKQDCPHATLVAAWRKAAPTPSTRWIAGFGGSRGSVGLRTLAEAYVTARNGDTESLRHDKESAAQNDEMANYLWEFYRKLLDDCNSSLRQRELPVRTAFSDYPQLVECAGFLNAE